MELKEIKELIGLMEEHGLAEVEVERDGLRIHLKKAGAVLTETRVVTPPPAPAVLPVPGMEAPPAPAFKLIEVKSPMVGTFYRTPSPESPAFVEEGQVIDVGQVVCIIEAMKLMNEIKSEVKGKLQKVLVENGEPVEFGQTLFILEPV
jgi:acetyl-CoA carboxylase biotin carboxyl carrier protein